MKKSCTPKKNQRQNIKLTFLRNKNPQTRNAKGNIYYVNHNDNVFIMLYPVFSLHKIIYTIYGVKMRGNDSPQTQS